MQAARYNMEHTLLPTHPALVPESNVAFRVENEAVVEERWEAVLPPLQIAHQAT